MMAERAGLEQFLIWILITAITSQTGYADEKTALIERLKNTRAANIETIIEEQFEGAQAARAFSVADPYGQEATEIVSNWHLDTARDHEVCALRFVDGSKTAYELKGFETAAAAVNAGFTITHQGRCGSCSTLHDLSIYLANPNLTSPARQCARRTGLKRKRQCFEKNIGFTQYCAESWAYNALHTRQECLGVCIADYGFLNLIFHRYPGPNNDETGQLRPCLRCDEDNSGAGFKYSAGRTRRNSGIESAIERPRQAIYRLEHDDYF